jgi:hypothetical protein
MGTRVVYPSRFAWCFRNASPQEVGQGTFYPFGFTENEMLKLFWVNRYETLNFKGHGLNYNNYSIGGESYPVNISYTNTTFNCETNPDGFPKSETDLLQCYKHFGVQVFNSPQEGTTGVETNPPEESSDFHNSVGWAFSIGCDLSSNVLIYENLYYPFININIVNGSSAGVNGEDSIWFDNIVFYTDRIPRQNGYYNEDGILIERKTIDITFFGKKFSVIGARETYAAPSGTAVFKSNISYSDIEFSTDSHFPYAAKDGTPIYDTITGEQLQSPFA